jgi:hypothetical protein
VFSLSLLSFVYLPSLGLFTSPLVFPVVIYSTLKGIRM